MTNDQLHFKRKPQETGDWIKNRAYRTIAAGNRFQPKITFRQSGGRPKGHGKETLCQRLWNPRVSNN
jgi:hypothetical protein